MDVYRDLDVRLEGYHKAYVLNNIDPKGREALFVRVLDVHDVSDIINGEIDYKYGIWIEHCAPSSRNSGDVPDVGEEVYMLFEGNSLVGYDPTSGIWLGVVRKNNFER